MPIEPLNIDHVSSRRSREVSNGASGSWSAVAARAAATASIAGLMLLSAIGGLGAASINIVALGASNTAGKGVDRGSAWPARLQAMLQARGYDAQVLNAGINGDDTGRMLARLDSAVPNGTHIVILDKASSNDRMRGINTAANVAAISDRLRKRNVKTIVIPGMHGWAGRQLQADGVHITETGHAAVAAHLVPQVAAAIGMRGHR
jgi:acyl-CoA thioesterase I